MEVAAATEELSVEEVSEVAEVAAKEEETEAVVEVETSPETEAAPEEEAATEEAAEEVTIKFCQTQLGNTFELSALHIQQAHLLNGNGKLKLLENPNETSENKHPANLI